MQLDKNSLISTLKILPHIVQDYLRQIPPSKLDLKRGPDVWTIREHLYHIVGLQQMLYERMAFIKNDPNPVIKPYTPTPETEAQHRFNSIDEALLKYLDIRNQQIVLVEDLTVEEMSKKALHPEYEDYGMSILLSHIIFHEYWHLYRIEEIWLAKDVHFS